MKWPEMVAKLEECAFVLRIAGLFAGAQSKESLMQSDESELRGYFSSDCDQILQESFVDFKKAGHNMAGNRPQGTEVRFNQGFLRSFSLD